ncbi:hypothetical protein J2Z60_001410 [Lactobacillus colini]|uniref:DUF3284 domain-containing protein n=1 Tax=Lactobacillus colini TaxID=1819254 RepID=A0ABS4MEY3_9LACO|nr:hypothetical protein [Lactobacillus colini]MBP2058233.1 hypothetical protein [Lactobacillus colini]
MNTNTLTYRYFYKADPQKMYQTLLNTQLEYFQMHDKSIKELHVGDKINTTLKTKINHDSVTTMEVTKIIPNEEFQLVTHQVGNHDITQTFKFKKSPNGSNELDYSERTNVTTFRGQSYFFLAKLLYKFFYNRGMKKRMQQLENLALN